MALTDRKKNLIVADWKTGAFSMTKLAKKHKVSTNTVKRICTGITHDTAPLVEALHEVEILKNSTKSAQEVKSAQNIVKMRLKTEEITNLLHKKLHKKIKQGKAQKVVTVGQGMGASQSEVVEYDYQPEHYEKFANTLNTLAKANGLIESASKIDVHNQNIQQNKIEIVLED